MSFELSIKVNDNGEADITTDGIVHDLKFGLIMLYCEIVKNQPKFVKKIFLDDLTYACKRMTEFYDKKVGEQNV